jgi:hypothetical protein
MPYVPQMEGGADGPASHAAFICAAQESGKRASSG